MEGVYEHHVDRLEGSPFVDELRDTIVSEVTLLFEQIVSYADNKKAELDAAAAARAKKVLEDAQKRASSFSQTILKIEKEIEMKQNQLMNESELEAKKAKQAQIDKLKLSLEEQKNRKSLATLEVERLQEGATNSEALQTLAEEIASAKDKTDAVVRSLKTAKADRKSVV